MTNNEFKAWFEGFSEGIEGAPTEKQWSRVVEQVKKIDGVAAIPYYVDRVVYRDRYQWPSTYPLTYCATANGHTTAARAYASSTEDARRWTDHLASLGTVVDVDSMDAKAYYDPEAILRAAGKADFETL